MGSVDKAAIVWTIAIVLIGASVAIVGSNFVRESKQDMILRGFILCKMTCNFEG